MESLRDTLIYRAFQKRKDITKSLALKCIVFTKRFRATNLGNSQQITLLVFLSVSCAVEIVKYLGIIILTKIMRVEIHDFS